MLLASNIHYNILVNAVKVEPVAAATSFAWKASMDVACGHGGSTSQVLSDKK